MAVYPDDVVVTIIKELKDDRTTLVNLARTCKHFYALTEPYRFRKIHLRNEFDAFLLHEHFKKKDSLRHMVDTLVIAPKKNGQVQDFWLLEQAITKLPRLQNLFIRFPNKPIARYYRDFFYVRRWTDNLAFTALRSCKFIYPKSTLFLTESLIADFTQAHWPFANGHTGTHLAEDRSTTSSPSSVSQRSRS